MIVVRKTQTGSERGNSVRCVKSVTVSDAESKDRLRGNRSRFTAARANAVCAYRLLGTPAISYEGGILSRDATSVLVPIGSTFDGFEPSTPLRNAVRSRRAT